eukprot:6173129-Pleurochrysis_carterae.AAC.1
MPSVLLVLLLIAGWTATGCQCGAARHLQATVRIVQYCSLQTALSAILTLSSAIAATTTIYVYDVMKNRSSKT